jgi:hypothetical protein
MFSAFSRFIKDGELIMNQGTVLISWQQYNALLHTDINEVDTEFITNLQQAQISHSSIKPVVYWGLMSCISIERYKLLEEPTAIRLSAEKTILLKAAVSCQCR